MIALLCLLAAGCSATPAAPGTDPSTSAAPSPTPSASTTATAAAPTAPLAGGCDALSSLAGVEDVVGDIQRVTTLDSLWQVAIETSGGLTCSMLTTRAAVQVYILPDALVTGRIAELTDTPECEDTARAMECRASVASEGTVTLVAGTFARAEDVAASLEVVQGLATAIGAVTTAGSPAPMRASTWLEPLDCDQVAETIGITSILGSEKVRPFIVPTTAETVDSRLAQAMTAGSRCDWSRASTGEGDRGSRFSIVAVPGGAWAWKNFSTQIPDSAAATVVEFPARVTSGGDVYIAAGGNVLHIEGSGLAGISVVDTSGGVLSVLDSKVHGGVGARD